MQSLAKVTLEVILVAALSAWAATFGPWVLGITVVVCAIGLLWLHDYLPFIRRRAKRKGRKGLLNLSVDLPKAMAAQDKRLHAIANLSGQLLLALKGVNLEDTDTHEKRIAVANRAAATIRPIAAKMRAEAKGFQAETTQFSTGFERWLEIAERERVVYGLAEQVPNLVRMFQSGSPVLPVLERTRGIFEKLRGASDTLDASCGEVVDALDIVTAATAETVAASESALTRIKALLEKTLPEGQ